MSRIFSIRASSLGDLFDCPARWEAKNLLKKKMPSSSRSQIGQAVHESIGRWDYLNMLGEQPHIEECKEVIFQQIWKEQNTEIDWSEVDQNTSENIATSLMEKYIQHIAPSQKFIGVEVLCESMVISDLNIELTGTIDRVYENEMGELGIGDIKTGKTSVSANGVVRTENHAVQMGVYSILASHALQENIIAPARIYGLTTAKTDKGQHVGIGEIDSPAEVLLGTEESPGLLHHASKILETGLFFGNSKSMLCHQKFCPNFSTCKFRK